MSDHGGRKVPSVVDMAHTSTLYLDATVESLSRMSAPILSTGPDPATAQLAAAAADEAVWDAFTLATFPDLNRRTTP